MAIGRPQMEEQIKGLQEGGATDEDPFTGPIDTSSIDPNVLRLMLLQANQPTYEERLEKYQQRLAPQATEVPKTDLYDVASALGSAILSSPSRNAYVGIGQGFSDVAQKLKQDQIRADKQRQDIASLAMQFAMQDEQRAQKLIDDATIKLIGNTNSDVKTTSISYVDPVSGKRINSLFINNDPRLIKILKDPEKFKAQEIIEDPDGVNIYQDLDKKTSDAIVNEETEWSKEARAQRGVLDKLQAARFYADQLSEEDFGNFEQLFGVPIKNALVDLGFGNLIDKEVLGAQIALNSVGTGLAMGLISQTKGAISDREMGLFLQASATLGNSKEGFLQILDITQKVANKAVGYNTAWLEERSRLQKERRGIAEIRAAQETFADKYHKENPLFEGSKDENGNDLFDPNATREENLSRLEEGTEAYNLVSRMTKESDEAYRAISERHTNISRENVKNQQKEFDSVSDDNQSDVNQKISDAITVIVNSNDSLEEKQIKLQAFKDNGITISDEIIRQFSLR